MKKTGKALGVLTALSMAVTAVFPGTALADLTEEQSGQISTVIVLAENDIQGNEAAIRILLEQCLAALDENDPMAATIRSVLLLLDSGSADAASVSVLLKSLLDSVEFGEPDPGQETTQGTPGETAPSPDQAPQTEPQPAAEQTEQPQPETPAPQPQTEPETMSPEKQAALANDPTRDVRYNAAGLPAYEVSSYIRTSLQESVSLDVPEDWGNNASGRALTSYSPVNDSGAISPAAGTLTVSYFPMESPDERTALDTYEKNIADMSVVTSFASEYVSAAQLTGRYLYFTMTVGANRFTCETFCFAYDGNIYAIELMQGQQTTYDYFPMYTEVVDSTQAGDMQVINDTADVTGGDAGGQIIDEIPVEEDDQNVPGVTDQIVDDGTGDGTIDDQIVDDGTGDGTIDDQIVDDGTGDGTIDDQIVDDGTGDGTIDEQIEDDGTGGDQIIDEQIVDDQPQIPENDPLISEDPEMTNVDENAILADIADTGDMSTFLYEIGGNIYMFPTAVSDIQGADIPLNPAVNLDYNFNSDADMTEGVWDELVNTQYFYFESSQYKEMAGVTNLQGYQIPITEGVVTALIDTRGEFINVTLPGGVKVGSYESDILKGFPRFAQTRLDGMAAFDGNELIYARNVRNDGCNGYALIKNDPPYYSALTIICDSGVIKEISFECLGSTRAEGAFLPE